MSMTLAQVGAGSGYLYVTLADGVTIKADIVNNSSAWQKIQQYVSAPLTDPTAEVDPTFGYRIFGNTAGSAGSLSGATELTRFLVNRASQAASYKKAITIASGIITMNRVTNDATIIVDTEGGAGTDDLDTITYTDVVDNDYINIIGANAAHIVTVKNGTGNIHLANSSDFSTGDKTVMLTLRYLSGAWYEQVRSNILPNVTNQRANGVSIPIQGINSAVMGTSGTTTYLPGTDKGYQIITGSPVLVGNITITTGGSPMDGDEFIVDYRATPTIGSNTINIFGIALTTVQTGQKCIIITKYKTSNTTWYSNIYVNGNAIDFATTTQLATKQDTLPTSGGDTYVLQKTIAGALSFVPNGSSNGWALTGNSGTIDGTNFLGTTDNIPISIRVNNILAGKIDSSGTTFFGYQAGNITMSDTTSNQAVGYKSLGVNTTGLFNLGDGVKTLMSNTTGSYNTAVGQRVLESNVSGQENTGVGNYSLWINLGSGNTGVGTHTLITNTTGSNNTAIGNFADVGSGALTNATAIGANSVVSASNCLVLGNAVNVGIGNSAPTNLFQVTGSTGEISITQSGLLIQKDLITDKQLINVANDAFYDLPAGSTGWGTVYAGHSTTCDGFMSFRFTSNGTVTEIAVADAINSSTTDTAGKLCVFDNGSNVRIKNRTGGNVDLLISVTYR